MKQFGFVFELGELVRGPEGTKVKFEIDEKVPFELDDIKPLSNVKCDINFMKLEDGILAEIKDLSIDLEFECTKCRDNYTYSINVPESNRLYFFEKQKDVQDIMDTFYFDLKNMQIDVTDFLRQEIILHFPMIPVCSNSCKGLCPVCGINLNKKSCNCKKGSKQEKPLAILKQLYNAKTSGTEEKDS